MRKKRFFKRLYWSLFAASQLYGQANFPFKSLKRIKRVQSRRIRKIVSFAYRKVPYYRETMNRMGLTPDDFNTAQDLGRLPIIERIQVQKDPAFFSPHGKIDQDWLEIRTGGSTGEPCTIFYDPSAVFTCSAAGYRGRSIVNALIGKETGYRETFVSSPTGSGPEIYQYMRARTSKRIKMGVHRQDLTLLDPIEEVIEKINGFKPDVIGGYGSFFTLFFNGLKSHEAVLSKPKVITYSADPMPEPVRNAIEAQWEIPVLSSYRSVETFSIGFECLHHGLHVNIDLTPLRIVDENDRSLPDGNIGQVLISNLINRATVLLNYRLGDLAQTLPGRCPCGRHLPIMSLPLGKIDDFIWLPDGKRLHPQVLRAIFTSEPHVWQYQIHQKSPLQFDIRILVGESCDRESLAQRIDWKFRKNLPKESDITVRFVNAFERTRGVKVRTVISDC